MCLAVPLQITTILSDHMVRCRIGQGDSFIEASTMLLEEMPEPGDFIIVHAGFALKKLDPFEAKKNLELLYEIAQKTIFDDQ